MIVRYSHDEHHLMLRGWLAARQMGTPPKAMFSDCGFVVDEIAIGFLFKCSNSPRAWVDDIAADPTVERWERDEALVYLFHILEEEAVQSGCKLITVLAQAPTMKTRIEKLGWRPADGPYSLYAKIPGGPSCHGQL